MAKGTHASGASFTEHEQNDPEWSSLTRPQLGLVDQPTEEQEESTSQANPADGMDSSPSSKSGASPTESSTPSDPKPAPTTENLSNPTEPADSSANSTDGGGQRAPRKPSSRPAKKTANPRAARVRSTDDEFDEFE